MKAKQEKKREPEVQSNAIVSSQKAAEEEGVGREHS